jgi:glycine/D-amino acid oxidase-like deaminating enzyme
MSARSDVLVVGGGPVGACAAQALAADGASVTLIEKEAEVCPPVSGAHANCGLPVVGRAPRRERVILATGHCVLDLTPFSPVRFG